MDTQVNLTQAQQITRTMTIVEEMHTRLFGNGQPGELDKLGKRLETLDGEIETLKETRAHVKGVIWTIGVLFTAMGGTELWHIFKH